MDGQSLRLIERRLERRLSKTFKDCHRSISNSYVKSLSRLIIFRKGLKCEETNLTVPLTDQLYPIVRFDQRDFDLFILSFLGLARFGPSFQAKPCALTRPAFYHTIGGVGHGFHQHEVDLWVWSGLQIWSVPEIVWHMVRSDERYLLTHVRRLCHVSLLDDVRCHLGQNPRPVWAHCSDSSPCFERLISHRYLWSKNTWKFNPPFLI